MDEMRALRDFSRAGEDECLNISCNPSSWLANRFVEFYNLHYEENLHCQVYTDSVANIMNRVRDYKDGTGELLTEMDVAVVTNSDYIMERMLKNSRLANISGSYLTKNESHAVEKGIELKQENNQVIFGYLKREGEKLGKAAVTFVEFVKKSL